jgi:hypothetical protein
MDSGVMERTLRARMAKKFCLTASSSGCSCRRTCAIGCPRVTSRCVSSMGVHQLDLSAVNAECERADDRGRRGHRGAGVRADQGRARVAPILTAWPGQGPRRVSLDRAYAQPSEAASTPRCASARRHYVEPGGGPCGGALDPAHGVCAQTGTIGYGCGARGERPRSPRTGVDECSSLHESTEDYGAKRSEQDPSQQRYGPHDAP